MLVRVTFREGGAASATRPRKTTAVFNAGHNLLEIAQSHAVAVNAPCGGQGQCGKCLVRVASGPRPVSDNDSRLLSESMIDEGIRLACQLRPKATTTVDVLGRFDVHAGPSLHPGPAFDPNRRPDRVFLAVDLGSTTVEMRVLEPSERRVLGTVSLLNKQVRRGHDVMTRMTYALRHAHGREQLTADTRDTLREAWEAARVAFASHAATPLQWFIAGNSVMTHLFWGETIDTLAEAPYRPAFVGARQADATRVGLPGDSVYTFPLLGSFVGGDTASGLLAAGFDRLGPARFLIDMGTNTEVALSRGRRLLVCSTPAGPAFEAGNISVGMRAEPGAIASIEVRDQKIRAVTIGSKKARGVCGTGLLQAVVELVRHGLVARDGAIASGDDRIVLARNVALLQADIRELQLAKAALRAATQIVLEQAGIAPLDLSAICLAGAFGAHLLPRIAIEAGLLPSVQPSIVQAVGNTSLDGACAMARDSERSTRALDEIRSRVEHVELATHPSFESLFVAHLGF